MPGLRQEIAAEVAELKKKKTRFDRVSGGPPALGGRFSHRQITAQPA
jgi:hypothetical protein